MKTTPCLRHRIQVGRQPASGAKKTHAIGTGCVERDEDDVGMEGVERFGGGKWLGAGPMDCRFWSFVLSLRADKGKQSQEENNPPTSNAHKKRESTIGRLPKDFTHAALKHELDRELHIPRSTLSNDGIAGKDIGSLCELSECIA